MPIGNNLRERKEREHHVLVGMPMAQQLAERIEDKTSRNGRANMKNKRTWIQRDSMTRRNALLVGKEGSRRRNRFDNDNFTHHPCAILNPADLPPPGYTSDIPRFHFYHDEITAKISITDAGHFLNAKSTRTSSSIMESPSMQIPRAMRQSLKKSHVPRGIVQKFETELRNFLEYLIGNSATEEHDWVFVKEKHTLMASKEDEMEGLEENEKILITDSEKPLKEIRGPMYLVWEIGDRFSRWVVHAMCKYYELASFSSTTSDGRRLTYVCHPNHLSLLSELGTLEENPGTSLPSLQTGLRIPEHSFFDYLFP